MKHSITGILLLTIFLFAQARAQFDQTDTTATKPKAPADTLRHFTVPIPFVGSIERSPTVLVTDSSINFMDYTYSGDLLSMVPGVFIRSLASPGQHHGITIDGLDDRNIAFMSDGVLLNEPYTGTFDPYLYPSENIERVEIITGPRAFLYGLNSTGMAVNFVSKSKKAIHASTRIRYQEASYGQGFVDGMFSQDIIRGLNMTAGAQHATYGGRFPNSDYDAWNGRMKLRYNVSNKLDFFVSGMYNQTRLGLNGGIDISKTPDSTRYDRLLAVVVDSSAYEKVTRYDLQVGMAGNFFADTTATTMLTLYHSTNFREYRDNENNQSAGYVKEDTRSQWYGAKFAQHLAFGDHTADVGAEMQSRGVIASDLSRQDINTLASVFGTIELNVQGFQLSPIIRLNRLAGHNHISYGGEAIFPVAPKVQTRISYSSAYDFPTLQKDYFPDTLLNIWYSKGDGEYSLFEASIRYNDRQSNAKVELFEMEFPWMQEAGWPNPAFTQESIWGLNITAATHLGFFYSELNGGNIIGAQEGPFSVSLPKLRFSGGAYFWDKLFAGHLDLKTGLRLKTFSSYSEIDFNAQKQTFFSIGRFYSSSVDIPGTATLDFLLIAHIGSAYVHLVMENLLDRKYVITSFYPMNERNLRFGLSWDFLD